MAFTYPGSAVLGSSKTGLAIGYRLVNLDGTQNAAFSTTNVVETSVPGNYTVTGGISLPDGFSGRIEWGTSGSKFAELWIGPNDYERVGNLPTATQIVSAIDAASPDVNVKSIHDVTILGDGSTTPFHV